MGQPPGTGLPESREKVLKMDGAFAPRVFRIDGLSGRGLWYRLTAMNINAACGSAPFGGWRHHLSPVGSMSLNFRVAMLPYKSSSFATPQAGAQQPALDIERFLWLLFSEALLSHRSAGGRWCRKAPKGGEPPEAAKHRDAYLADESKSIKPESAGSWQLEADCFRLYMQWLFITDRDLLPIASKVPGTEILRLRLRMTAREGKIRSLTPSTGSRQTKP